MENDCLISSNCKKFSNGTCLNPEFCIRKFKIYKYYDMACLSEKMKQRINFPKNLEDICETKHLQNIADNIKEFVSNGRSLYIHSPITGNGKTAWAVELIKSYINVEWYSHDMSPIALFINVPRYLLGIKDAIGSHNEFAEHVKKYVFDCPLVVWDDIATKDMSEFEREHLLSIIDYRFNSNLSNIFTSNVAPTLLSSFIGKRLSSRICGNTEKIKFIGEDKRGK